MLVPRIFGTGHASSRDLFRDFHDTESWNHVRPEILGHSIPGQCRSSPKIFFGRQGLETMLVPGFSGHRVFEHYSSRDFWRTKIQKIKNVIFAETSKKHVFEILIPQLTWDREGSKRKKQYPAESRSGSFLEASIAQRSQRFLNSFHNKNILDCVTAAGLVPNFKI